MCNRTLPAIYFCCFGGFITNRRPGASLISLTNGAQLIKWLLKVQGKGTEKPNSNMPGGPLPAFAVRRHLKMEIKRHAGLIPVRKRASRRGHR